MTTVNLVITDTTDDQFNDNGSLTGTTFVSQGDIGGNSRNGGYRFRTGATIPNGATISAALFTVQANSSSSSATCKLKVSCEAADNPGVWSNGADFSGRSRTTGTSWNPVPAWTANTDYSPPDIAAEVQAVVNRAGWSSGNAIIVYLDNNASDAEARRSAKDYSTSTTLCGRLDITYGAAATVIKDLLGGGIIPFAR